MRGVGVGEERGGCCHHILGPPPPGTISMPTGSLSARPRRAHIACLNSHAAAANAVWDTAPHHVGYDAKMPKPRLALQRTVRCGAAVRPCMLRRMQ